MNNPAKILVVAPLGVGGVTGMMINIQKNLNRDLINFDYLTIHNRKEPCEDQVIELGSRKLVASSDHVPRIFRRIFRINEIRRVCKENNVKILHYNADSPLDLTNIIAAKLGGVKHITIHSHNASYSKNSGKLTRLASDMMRPFLSLFCDNYWGCSDLAARFVFPNSVIKKGSYAVLPNGIELDKYDFNIVVRDKIRKELGIEDKFVVGHAGRFSPQKNHSYLLEIFKKVYDKDKTATLLLFGVGELTGAMKEKASMLGISDAVIFYGASDKMHEMFQAMDVFVMPSLHEGLPVTGVEAQASGLPCVFADTITKEVDITNNSKFLSLNDSAEEWANAVLSLKNSQRISGVEALRAANYDIKKTAETVEEYYLKIIGKLEQ